MKGYILTKLQSDAFDVLVKKCRLKSDPISVIPTPVRKSTLQKLTQGKTYKTPEMFRSAEETNPLESWMCAGELF